MSTDILRYKDIRWIQNQRLMHQFTSPSCIDVQLGQRQGEGQLSALGVDGTLEDVVQGVPPSRPAGGDEVCVCDLNIRHRSSIIHTATPTKRAVATLIETPTSSDSAPCIRVCKNICYLSISKQHVQLKPVISF